MADRRFPFIRGKTFRTEFYQSPQGGGGGAISLPPRRPSQHAANLVTQLDNILSTLASRVPGTRDPEAVRELVAVEPESTYVLPPRAFGDAAHDAQVLGTTAEGIVLVDAKDPTLVGLRHKIEDFADDSKKSKKGGRKNAAAIAPIHEIRLPTEVDLVGPRLRNAGLAPETLRWFEVACRGGVHHLEETASSRRQVQRQASSLGLKAPQDFVATEQVVFFLRATLQQLRVLLASVDCVQEFDLAPPEVRDWLLLSDPPVRTIQAVNLTPPPESAPSVVLLDTGIADAHPLLRPAILSATSAVPGDVSSVDTHGHGTQMAGVALHGEDLGVIVEQGGGRASHWLQSVRLLVGPRTGSAAEENRTFWPRITEQAVASAEAADPVTSRPRVYGLATSYGIDLVEPTYWSHAIDRLAFNGGTGRLLVVAAGNADVTDLGLLLGYPTLNLQQKVQEPAQAANALTVGAFTTKTLIPPEPVYATARPIAPTGGISPHTTSGLVAAGFGPDIVMEGGNVAFDGQLPDFGVATLNTLTTGHRFLTQPLSLINATSEATARASRIAATIWSAEADLRPATVRALIVHSASYTSVLADQFPNMDERLAVCGYGVPDEAIAIACALDRATVIFEDEMPNAVTVAEPKKKPPKTDRGSPTEQKFKRYVKFFRVPFPEDQLLREPDLEVELRVTLSYMPEPNTFRRSVSHGLDLKWDMQGPAEQTDVFVQRVNKLARGDDAPKGKSFPWQIGKDRRSRSTVQSDRWVGSASMLAGEKLIAVVPVLGWWERREALRTLAQPFSLVVTVRAAGLTIYPTVRAAVEGMVEVDVPAG